MPGVITHHLFGKALGARLGAEALPTRDERDAFLLGNQGPDPFFYAQFTPRFVGLKRFGSQLHTQAVDASITALREAVGALGVSERRLGQAWLEGYICHFTLDSYAHPLIFAEEQAYVHAGVPGLRPRDRGVVHNQIEADLDTMVLARTAGLSVREFIVPRQVLLGNEEVLAVAGRLLTRVARDVYGRTVPLGAYAASVRDFRFTLRFTYSPGGTKRELLGHIERLFKEHSRMQAISHRGDAGATCPYSNEEHRTWHDPATGEARTESFTDLYAQAQIAAAQALAALAQGAPTPELTHNLDFDGRPQAVN
jgi:hypothetical protein